MPTNPKEKLLEDIDLVTAPDKMSAKDAILILEELASDIDGRIEGLRDDLQEEQ